MSVKNFQINSTRSRFGSVTIIRDPKETRVKLYDTDVVIKRGKTITLHSGGWRTQSTQMVMNRAMRQLLGSEAPFVRRSKKRPWTVEVGQGVVLPYIDGIKLVMG